MATRLKNTLQLVNLAPGATVVLPHGLRTQERPLAPDCIFVPSPDLNITSDETNVTVTNGGVTISGSILVEAWHTIERAFGSQAGYQASLTPKPWIVVGSDVGNAPPQPEFPVIAVSGHWIQTTIYARTTGSDVTGTGTLANPFRTYARARREVPKFIEMGYGYIVDITDLGVETLPQDYTDPCTTGCPGTWVDPTPAVPYLKYFGPLICRAIPKLAFALAADATITGADLAVVAAVGPGLCKVTIAVARAAWVAGSLKGKQVIKTLSGAEIPCTIFDNTTTELFLSNTALAFNGGAGALVLGVGETLNIVEPSATLEAPPSAKGVAIDCGGVEVGCVYQGVRTRATVPGMGFGQAMGKVLNATFELCELVEPALALVGAAPPGISLIATTVTAAVFASTSDLSVQRSYWSTPGIVYLTGEIEYFDRTVFEGCAHLGVNYDRSVPLALGFENCWMIDGTEDAISMVSPGRLDMTTCQIDGSAINGIKLDGPLQAVLLTVTGSGNVGEGVITLDGAHVRVNDATSIGDADGRAYTNGDEVAVAAWPAVPFSDPDLATLSRVSGV